MDLSEAYNFLLFWLNQKMGTWYPPEELDALADKGQLSYYEDCFIKYGTGQRLTDALSPLKATLSFDPIGNPNPNGLVSTPDEYLDLIRIYTTVLNADNSTATYPCPILNEDEITGRINSQVIPLSIKKPFAEVITNWNFQLYPKVPQTGVVTYFKRPPKPKFVYTVVSGRVIVYNAPLSTQLVWADTQIQSVLIKALNSIGINLSEQDLITWSEQKDQQNLLSVMKI